jgi:broad specificity phosphatase PhoE
LLQAALLWRDQRQGEQAAYWLGYVQAHVALLTAEQRRQAERLAHELENELDNDVLSRALENGKLLNLDEEIDAIYAAL